MANDGNRYAGGGGRNLLLNDLAVAYLILKEISNRGIERTFGATREQSGTIATIALATFADSADRQAQRLRQPPPKPSLGDMVLATVAVKEAVHAVAGPWSREREQFGTLIMFAAGGALVAPFVRKGLHRARVASARARA